MAGAGKKDQGAEFETLDEACEQIGDEVLEEEQLTLADEDERLPWLESDDEEDETTGTGAGLIMTVALIGLLGIAVILGLVWWLGRDGAGDGPVADGSTIAAPETPYKSRPDDPGGTQVTGTGDMSFEQGEGQRRETQIAADPVPAPGFSEDNGAAGSVTAGVGIQIGAYSTREQAQTGWKTLRERFDVLNGLGNRILEAEVDGARVFRLQAVAGDAASARSVCNAIKAGGGDCQVKN